MLLPVVVIEAAAQVAATSHDWKSLLDLMNNMVVPLLLYNTVQLQTLRERMVRVETRQNPKSNQPE